jgi:hypothetical protein
VVEETIYSRRTNLIQSLNSLKTHVAWKAHCTDQRRGNALPFWNLIDAADQDIRVEISRFYILWNEFLEMLKHERLTGEISPIERDSLRSEAMILKREADELFAGQHL